MPIFCYFALTRLEGREPVTGLLPLGAWQILLQTLGGVLVYEHVSW